MTINNSNPTIYLYLFVPIAAETMGAISKDGMDFLCEFGRRITQCTDDHARAPSSFSDYPF